MKNHILVIKTLNSLENVVKMSPLSKSAREYPPKIQYPLLDFRKEFRCACMRVYAMHVHVRVYQGRV